MKSIGMSKIGLVRKRNEDRFHIEAPFYIVTDGMGGYKGGEIASTLAADEIAAHLRHVPEPGTAALKAAIEAANHAVVERVQAEPELKGMGTTAVVAYIVEDTLYWANVGDSRLYVFSDQALHQVTTDHSMVQSLYEEGKLEAGDLLEHPQRNILTRAVGVADDLEVDTGTYAVKPGDRLLLCSDGLTGYVAPDVIEDAFRQEPSDERLLEDLIKLVYAKGARDNVTIVVGTI